MHAVITKAILWLNTGGLSKPSKMPGRGWGISAHWCKRGAALRKIAGSTCESCYALKGQYVFKTVLDCHKRRIDAFNRNTALWIKSMIALINCEYMRKPKPLALFRWLDSGDLQSPEMLQAFTDVARHTPETKHWQPTRETGIVRDFFKAGGELPDNYCLRVSSDMVDQFPLQRFSDKGVCYSMVVTGKTHPNILKLHKVHICPATNPEIEAKSCEGCGCTACWNRNVKVVAYHKH